MFMVHFIWMFQYTNRLCTTLHHAAIKSRVLPSGPYIKHTQLRPCYHKYLFEVLSKHMPTWGMLVVMKWKHISIHAMFASMSHINDERFWPKWGIHAPMSVLLVFRKAWKFDELLLQCFTFAKSYRNIAKTMMTDSKPSLMTQLYDDGTHSL